MPRREKYVKLKIREKGKAAHIFSFHLIHYKILISISSFSQCFFARSFFMQLKLNDTTSCIVRITHIDIIYQYQIHNIVVKQAPEQKYKNKMKLFIKKHLTRQLQKRKFYVQYKWIEVFCFFFFDVHNLVVVFISFCFVNF